jgi:hypothetical protein
MAWNHLGRSLLWAKIKSSCKSGYKTFLIKTGSICHLPLAKILGLQDRVLQILSPKV